MDLGSLIARAWIISGYVRVINIVLESFGSPEADRGGGLIWEIEFVISIPSHDINMSM